MLDIVGGARLLALPGHTPGSIALQVPALRVVLTGDTAAEQGGGVVLCPFSVDRVQAWSDLVRLAELNVEVACFGHGEPVLTGAAAALAQATDLLA